MLLVCSSVALATRRLADTSKEFGTLEAGASWMCAPAGTVHDGAVVDARAPNLAFVLAFVLGVDGFFIEPGAASSVAFASVASVLMLVLFGDSGKGEVSFLLSAMVLTNLWDLPVLGQDESGYFLFDVNLER